MKLIFRQMFSVLLSVLLANPAVAQTVNHVTTVTQTGNVVARTRMQTVEIPISSGVKEIRHSYSIEVVNTVTGKTRRYVEESRYVQDLRIGVPVTSPIQSDGYICDGFCHQVDSVDRERIATTLTDAPLGVPLEANPAAKTVERDLKNLYPEYQQPTSAAVILEHRVGYTADQKKAREIAYQMAHAQNESFERVSQAYQQKWAERDAIQSYNNSAVHALENYHTALVQQQNISTGQLAYELGRMYNEIPTDIAKIIVDPSKAQVTYKYVSNEVALETAGNLPVLLKTDPIAAALSVIDAVSPWQKISDPLKPFVDSQGVLKGPLLKANTIKRSGTEADQYRIVRAANLLQASEMKTIKASDTVYGSNLLVVATNYLQAAQAEFARGAREEAESYLKTAEMAIQYLTGIAMGAGEAFIDDVTGLITLAAGGGKLLSSYFKDPQKTHELAVKSLRAVVENIDKLSADAWNKTKDSFLHGSMTDVGKVVGSVGYQVISLWYPPLLLGKAGITAKVVGETAEVSAKAAARLGQLAEEAQRLTKMAGREVDFIAHPNGIIPNQAYRYIKSGHPDISMIKEKGIISNIGKPNDKTYAGFEKFDDATKAATGYQINVQSDPIRYRAEFKLSDVTDHVEIPKSNWGEGPDLEPITKSFPRLGDGGLPQIVLSSDVKVDRLIDLETGKIVWERSPK